MADIAGLRIRQAVRALVVDPDLRVLLVRFEFPDGTRWALPGGGLDPGETAHDGLRREMLEEIGLADPAIGPHLWNRLHVIPFIDMPFDGQREQVYEVLAPAGFEPNPQFSWEQLNAEHLYEIRWWTVAEVAGSDATFVPRNLCAHLADYLANGPPTTPIDVEV
ncbi:MAG: NUDIX domain-containing protein [Ilumatobacteraceae bacterium]